VIRTLLLGGSGFVGGRVLRAFHAAGIDVLSIRRKSSEDDPPGAWTTLDLTDRAATHSLIADVRPATIVNCAGATVGSDDQLERANVVLLQSVLAAMNDTDPCPRLIHLGSSAEYGSMGGGRPIRETDPANPVSAYGRSKLRATAAALASAMDPPPLVLRVFNPVGPGAPSSSLLGAALLAMRDAIAADEGEIRLGALDAERDFIHVDDVADAVLAAARHPEVGGEVVNVGSGQATSAREVVRLLADRAGFRGRILEAAPLGSTRSGAVASQVADIRRAAAALGWQPTRTLVDAIDGAWVALSSGSASD
jgi:nucleoside-diphosphate-sugar epimerase